MKRTAKLAIAVAIAALASCSAPQPKEVLPIMAWYSIPPEHATVERYQELAEAGFNISFSPMYSTKDMLTALDLGEKTGVKIMAMCNELYSKTDSTVKLIKDHPALYGYFLRDEPLPPAFPDLAAWAQRIKDADTTHVLYLNLFPSYVSEAAFGCSYREYTRRFIEEVKLPLVSFDNYPIVYEGIRQMWYENLEIISEESERAGLPFWAFTLSTSHGMYPMPTLASMRIQLYTDLAYGAQGVQYFTYWNPIDDYFKYHDASIGLDLQKSCVYPLVQELNKELQARAGIFVGSKVLSVRHTGENIPPCTKPLEELPAHVTVLKTNVLNAPDTLSNAEAKEDLEMEEYDPVKAAAQAAPFMPTWISDGGVVSVLEKGKYQYLMLVNRSVIAPMEVEIAFDTNICIMDRAGNPVKASKKLTTYTVEEGDCIIFRYKK